MRVIRGRLDRREGVTAGKGFERGEGEQRERDREDGWREVEESCDGWTRGRALDSWRLSERKVTAEKK